MMPASRRAFTLIELLVVIAVIGLMAAILLPVLSRARDAAHTQQCVSNLRQLGNGVQLYEQDFEDHFPLAIDFWDRNLLGAWAGWDGIIPNASATISALANEAAPDGSPFGGQIDRVLRPYTASDEIWRCPGDTGVAGIGAATATSYGDTTVGHLPVWRLSRGSGTWGGTSYVYRTELGLHLLPVSRLRLPSKTNVFMDAAWYWHARLHRAPKDAQEDWLDYNQGSINILYADGHVRNENMKDYNDSWWQPYFNSQGVNTWNPFE